jgi:hypothetical protein
VDVRDVLRDGERLRVPAYLMDAERRRQDDGEELTDQERADAVALLRELTEPKTDGSALRVTDGTDDPYALHRPGPRYLVADHRSTEHARLVSAMHMADQAYRDYDLAAMRADADFALPSADASQSLGDAMARLEDVRRKAIAERDAEDAEAWRTHK